MLATERRLGKIVKLTSEIIEMKKLDALGDNVRPKHDDHMKWQL